MNKRSTGVIQTMPAPLMVNTGFIQYLEDGLWYFSLLNDNKSPLKFRFKTQFYENANSNCPMNCNGKGECVNGKCRCFPQYSGIDCSQSKIEKSRNKFNLFLLIYSKYFRHLSSGLQWTR